MSKTRQFEEKIYKKNVKEWHNKHNRNKVYECHHAIGRIGCRLCCPHFFVIARNGHQDNINFVEYWRDYFKIKISGVSDEDKLLRNYLKGCGCFEIVFDECESCKMPVVGGR